jgi:putative ABC transport system permease protein
MWKATIRGILARKVRLGLTVVAVVLGVSFVTGIYVLTDTLDRSFGALYDHSLRGVDFVVRSRAPYAGADLTERDRFPASVLDQVREVDGVADAQGFLEDYAQFVDKDGKSIQTAGAPTRGITWSQRGTRGPLRLVRDGTETGRPPSGRHEVAIDIATAREHDFHVGDRVKVLLQGPAETFDVVGLFSFGDVDQLGALTFAAFDVPTAQAVFDAKDQLDAIRVTVGPGASRAAVRRDLEAALGGQYEVQTPAAAAADDSRTVTDFLSLATELLLGFAALGLVIGAFIIFNTFTILVTQRTRELGLLRAIGASGGQVVTSVLVEAALIGLVASVLGIALGVGLAATVLAIVEALGRQVPAGALVLEGRTIAAALGVGVGVTVVASLWAAVRAARTPPIVAIGDLTPAPPRSLRRRAVFGSALLLAGVPLLAIGLDRTREATNVTGDIWYVGAGALVVLLGALVLLAACARPLAEFLGLPLRAFGVAGTLARGNSSRNPRRTAATASALVIGLALVGLFAILADSVKASWSSAVDRGVRADFVLKAQQFSGFSPQVAERLRGLPELEAVAAFRFRNVRVGPASHEEAAAAVDPKELASVVNLRMRTGSIAAMTNDSVLLQADTAREYGVGPGDTLPVQINLTLGMYDVAGTYQQKDFTGGLPIPLIVSDAAYERAYGADEQDSLIYVKARGDVAAAKRAMEQALKVDFPNVDILSRSEYRHSQQQAVDQFLAILIALLLLALIIAVLGIVNTLSLSMYERTHEVGLLRAVGMARSQLRVMVQGEAALVALIGGVVGMAVSILWGWAFTIALRSQGITEFHLPVVQLVVIFVLSIGAGIVAALVPGLRASRLDVLDALHTD